MSGISEILTHGPLIGDENPSPVALRAQIRGPEELQQIQNASGSPAKIESPGGRGGQRKAKAGGGGGGAGEVCFVVFVFCICAANTSLPSWKLTINWPKRDVKPTK